MARISSSVLHFYDKKTKSPRQQFNQHIIEWLSGATGYPRPSPKAFEKLLALYKQTVQDVLGKTGDGISCRWQANRLALSRLTDVLFGVDLRPELASRLTHEAINQTGFRTTLAQGVAKNTGEAFINLIVYAVADSLKFQDEIIVDKGLPPVLRPILTLSRNVPTSRPPYNVKIDIPIEVDLCIFSRRDPTNAILLSAKTRLKEVFHIAVMWKLFFDSITHAPSLSRWGLKAMESAITHKMLYTFATADMIRKTGRETQGPDIERSAVRNLIQMDASFMDYVFVSKSGIPHVSPTLTLNQGREAIFHELGCLLDLIQQKFDVSLSQ